MKSKLNYILMQNSKITEEFIERSKNQIFEIIPELGAEDGFDQKSPWHIYDVWNHTKVALANSNHNLEERIALLLHDIGKPYSCQEDGNVRHFKGHAVKSAEMAKAILFRLDYDESQINFICWLIESHSSIVDIKNINKDNIERIKKLVNIQYCDTMAYNPDKIEPVLSRLNSIRAEISKKEREFYKGTIDIEELG